MVSEPTEHMLTYEEGQRVGGRVLYDEGPIAFKQRQTDSKAVAAFFIGSLGWLPPIGLWLAVSGFLEDPGNLRWLIGLAIAIPVLALCLLMAVWFRRSFRLLTHSRIHESGYSRGWGERPFFPKSLFYSIDERYGRRRDTPYAVITLKGGFNFSISAAPVRGATTFGDYKEVLGAFRQMVGHQERDPRWTEDAWRLTGLARHDRGPLRAVAEALADRHGATVIDEAFLESVWSDVRTAFLPERLAPFRAFRAIGRDSGPLIGAKPVVGPDGPEGE